MKECKKEDSCFWAANNDEVTRSVLQFFTNAPKFGTRKELVHLFTNCHRVEFAIHMMSHD